MRSVLILCCVVLFSSACQQKSVLLSNITDFYSIRIDINPDSSYYDGPATITLVDAQTNDEIQTFQSTQFICNLKNGKPSVNAHESANDMSPIFIDDFNFDGTLDIAICNGSHPNSKKPFFDIFLYHPKAKEFQFNEHLSLLTQYNNGIIDVHAEKMRISTQISKGCCVNEYAEYEMNENIPILSFKRTENVIGDSVEIIEDELVDGEWVRVIKSYNQVD